MGNNTVCLVASRNQCMQACAHHNHALVVVIILFEGVLAEIRLTLRTVNGLKTFCAAQHGHQVCDALPCASPLRMPPLTIAATNVLLH